MKATQLELDLAPLIFDEEPPQPQVAHTAARDPQNEPGAFWNGFIWVSDYDVPF